MTCRPCLDTYIHTYKQTINQYKQIVIIHKSIETYSYTYTWLRMVRPPQPTHRGGAGTLCVHVVSLCADTKTMTCRPCWDTHILTYQQTDSQTHRHTYINQYKHIVIPIHGCICVTYPPFGGGGGGEPGGAGSYMCAYKDNISHDPSNYNGSWWFSLATNQQHPTAKTRRVAAVWLVLGVPRHHYIQCLHQCLREGQSKICGLRFSGFFGGEIIAGNDKDVYKLNGKKKQEHKLFKLKMFVFNQKLLENVSQKWPQLYGGNLFQQFHKKKKLRFPKMSDPEASHWLEALHLVEGLQGW